MPWLLELMKVSVRSRFEFQVMDIKLHTILTADQKLIIILHKYFSEIINRIHRIHNFQKV